MKHLHKKTAIVAIVCLFALSGCQKKPYTSEYLNSPEPISTTKPTRKPTPAPDHSKPYKQVIQNASYKSTTGSVYTFDKDKEYSVKTNTSLKRGTYWFDTDDETAMVVLCLKMENRINDEHYRMKLNKNGTITMLDGQGNTTRWSKQ